MMYVGPSKSPPTALAAWTPATINRTAPTPDSISSLAARSSVGCSRRPWRRANLAIGCHTNRALMLRTFSLASPLSAAICRAATRSGQSMIWASQRRCVSGWREIIGDRHDEHLPSVPRVFKLYIGSRSCRIRCHGLQISPSTPSVLPVQAVYPRSHQIGPFNK